MDSILNHSFGRFVTEQNDMESLAKCISIIKQNEVIKKLPISTSSEADALDEQLADCLYVYAAAYPKYKKVKSTWKQ